MRKRIIALLLAVLMTAPLTAVAYADGGAPVSMAIAGDQIAFDGETLYIPEDGELYVCFDLENYDGTMIPGWRNDLFKQTGFGIDDDPTFFPDNDFAYAHIYANGKQVGEQATLYYSWYSLADIFDDQGNMHWDTAEPVLTCSVVIEVVSDEEEAPRYLLGDSDGDGEVTILDATAIQRYLVSLDNVKFVLLCADTDRNGEIDILDATRIQRFLAGLRDGYAINATLMFGTYYATWNIGEELLPAGSGLTGDAAEAARAEIRCALNLLVDRNDALFTDIGKVPASTFVPRWITDADGTMFGANAGPDPAYGGYYNTAPSAYEANVAAAVETLKKYYQFDESTGKFTDFPALTYIHNDGDVHAAIAERVKEAFEAIGIEVTIEAKDWSTYLDELGNKDYSLARSGWVADYDDPMEFLSMWTSDNENNEIGFGQGAHKDAAIYSLDLGAYGIDYRIENGTWAQTYDVLISEIKKCEDPVKAYAMMHLAEDMLMSTGGVMAIYYY